MAAKIIILLSVAMYASAGHLAAPAYYAAPAAVAVHAPAYGTSSQQVVRSYDGSISQYSKAVDTPFSSVRKHDTRITNNLYPAYAAHSYAAPAVAYAAAPAHHVSYAAPVQHVSYAAPAQHVAYAAPAQHVAYAAPAQHVAYAAGSPYGYGNQVVSHVSFDGLGAHYAW